MNRQVGSEPDAARPRTQAAGTRWPRLAHLLTGAFMLGACALFAVRARYGLNFFPFADEAGHFLGAQAIHHGDILYRDYIDAHGPVVFMLTHLWGEIHGFANLGSARWISIASIIVAAIAVFSSSAFAGRYGRALAASSWIGLAAAWWIVQSFFLDDYFTIGSCFLIIELASITFPVLFGVRVAPAHAFFGGAAAPFAAFSAYTFAPSAALFLVPAAFGGVRDTATRAAAAGIVCGAVINLAWLTVFGDPVGYLVYHILINQIDYARYINLTEQAAIASMIPSALPWRLAHSAGVMAFAASAAFMIARVASRPGLRATLAAISAFGGIAFLDARFVVTFPDGAFLLVSFAALAMGLGKLGEALALPGVIVSMILVALSEIAARHATNSPFGYSRPEWLHLGRTSLGPWDAPLPERIRGLASPADRILVVPYNPVIYEWASRLPIRKYHAYLPWEADYARHPLFGRDRDLCVDLPIEKPKVIYYDRWIVWKLYDPELFMGCLRHQLQSDYRQDPQFPDLWVRKASRTRSPG